MAYELFGVGNLQLQKFPYRHPHEIVYFTGLRYQMSGFLVGKRYFVHIIVFIVKIGSAVQHAFVGGFKKVFQVFYFLG